MSLPEVADDLFRGVVFFVDDSIAAENRPSLIQDMIHRGATLCPPSPLLTDSSANNTSSSRVHPRFDLDVITHIISETWEIPERQLIDEHERSKEIFTVTTQWHTRSRILYLQDPHHYSPDPRLIFSGVFVSCLSNISTSDVDQIYATVAAFGGGSRPGVTQDVTHIVTRKVEKSHFDTIDTTKLGMTFVHPQWIIDCVKLQKRLPFQPYVFESPDIPPPILRPEWRADPSQHPSQHMTNLLKQQAIVDAEQENGWHSVVAAERMMKGQGLSFKQTGNKVFEGKKLILGCQIEVSADFRIAIESTISTWGGIVLPEERVRECDIYITPWREGKEYLRAVKHGKVIATLSWVNHVIKVSRLTSPKDNLLHYPVPRGGVPGLKDCSISVTNYTGDGRDYLKRLIGAMEAEFTTTLARETNTHLIAATKSGEKVARASIWNIPVLNHLFLEDCFIKWKKLPEAGDDRYTEFPYGVNFMTVLGNAKLTDKDLEPWTAPARDIDDDDDMQEIDGDITATGITPPTQVSEASQRDRTVRQADLDDLPADMNVDVEEPVAQNPSPLHAEDPHQPMSIVGAVPEELSVAQDIANQDQPVPRSDTTEMTPLSDANQGPFLPMMQDGAAEPVSSPLSGDTDDNAAVQAVGHASDLGPVEANQPDHNMLDIQEDNAARDPMPPPRELRVVVEAATSPLQEDEVVHTTQAKGKGSVRTAKKSRSVAATTTQPVKRRRLSIPEKPDLPAASQPVPEVRARRQAATKAADRLHNVIAPDMALHEKEKKRKDIVSPKSRRAARVGGNGEGSSRKAKQGTESADGEESTEDELEAHLHVKSTQRGGKKTAGASRGRSQSSITRDTARTRLTTRSLSVLSGSSGDEEDRTGDLDATGVRLMTTGFTLDEKLSKILRSLGVRFTDKPLEMTHLISRAAMRTTKLLVGLAKGVDILSVEWLEQSAELKRMIDPAPFMLKDPTNERKLGFELATSVARSKSLHEEEGGLFANKLFHITGRVKPDFDQIKDVVKAAGGDITRYISGKTRIPKDDQEPLILISCAEDKDLWQDLLTDGYNVVVYDKELLFTSILKMEMDMDDHKLTL